MTYRTDFNRDYKNRLNTTQKSHWKSRFFLLLAGISLVGLVAAAGTASLAPKKTAQPGLFAFEGNYSTSLPLALPAPQKVAMQSDMPQTRAAIPWKTVTVQKGDTLSGIFSRLNIHSAIKPLLASSKEAKRLLNLHPGNQIKVIIDAQGLRALEFTIDDISRLSVRRYGAEFITSIEHDDIEVQRQFASGVIESSLFAAGYKAGLDDALIMQLANIFAWDIDFALDIREGDKFTVLYESRYRDGEYIGHGDILGAEFSNQGKTYRALRYVNANGETGYYSPAGRNMRKAFLRTPVKFTRISSKFNLKRRHPILHKIRAHRGVDYAAPRGTPIKAAGDGKVTFAGRKGGYGKTVVLQHGQKYSTLYAHMSKISKKARNGKRVKQGQIIGYVGTTGRSTGPHLHYEFRVNGVHRDPLKVKLPKAEPLPRKQMADFRQQTASMMTQLDVLGRVPVAMLQTFNYGG